MIMKKIELKQKKKKKSMTLNDKLIKEKEEIIFRLKKKRIR